MALIKTRASFKSNITKVWITMTDLDNYYWRSDLSKLSVIKPDKVFIEYDKRGLATTFTITHFDPIKLYEFDIKNVNVSGHWTGKFYQDGSGTMVEFSEDLKASNIISKLLIKNFCKKQQKRYIEDLRKALKEVK